MVDLWTRITNEGDCQRWTGAHNPKGYGSVWFKGRWCSVHRVAYELAKGDIPAGMEIDHTCAVRDCINPAHLEPVTHADNIRRGFARRGPRKWCFKGHPLEGHNVFVRPDGRRRCRTCQYARHAEWRARKRAHLPVPSDSD